MGSGHVCFVNVKFSCISYFECLCSRLSLLFAQNITPCMDTFYFVIIGLLFLLAISDLIVGVSNDAVNFLNAAVGSRVGSLRTIMLVAVLGIVVGATFSSGMMEVARKGIFHPENFYFHEIMLLFLAVMVSDIILLDAFNSFGMPTSTTVSIVFELLGAAVAISLIKIYKDPNALALGEYINSAKALAIISGILLSVVVAFSVGLIIQALSRLLFSFNYEKNMKKYGALWGGLAITAITYFILVKGAKGASFMSDEMKEYIRTHSLVIIAASFVAWFIVLQLITSLTKLSILKMIVFVGTFALAMAFAGNDLVNFIGVPLAGYNAFEIFRASGEMNPNTFAMQGLAGAVKTPTLFLLLAGAIMSVTLWRSKKARNVIKTSLDLGRQNTGEERFKSFMLSRSLVRSLSTWSTMANKALPNSVQQKMQNQFDETPFVDYQKKQGNDAPAFDLLRAAVTLVVASILISIGTMLKLPLSTTYVTFMVFMGASLADGAWGRESAVFRVSGVLSVIGGWFFTAFSAFFLAFVMASVFYFGGMVAIGIVLAVSLFFIVRSQLPKKGSKNVDFFAFAADDGQFSLEQAISFSAANMNQIYGELSALLTDTLAALENEDRVALKNLKKSYRETNKRASHLKMEANKLVNRIDETQLEAGHFFLLVTEYLCEMVAQFEVLVTSSYTHVDNHHKPLLPDQIEEMKQISTRLTQLLKSSILVYETLDRALAEKVMNDSEGFLKLIRQTRKNQIGRVRQHEVGTRNSMLFLQHIGECRNLALFTKRLVQVCLDLAIPNEEATNRN